ncbi:MAG: serine/threonine protein kinase [Alphaproteobacteria bacterium]|nr:serine/threonine protein kinase [Alphaproteobacteria bacterium]
MTSDPDEALHTLLPEDFDPNHTIRLDDGDEGEVPTAAGSLDASLALGRVLGTGGMAVVREAEQRVLQRAVAVKSVRGDKARGAGQLVLEARITGALEHPGILPIHDIVLDGTGAPHIVMQRVDGTPWSDVMDDPAQLAESFGVSDVLGWNLGVLEAVCNAVHFAHSQGVVHRDLKPENVMVGAFGQVYVVDWGVAVSVREGDARFPAAAEQRRIVGTPRYMAPEMAKGDGRLVSARTDVYLLGAVLYRILAGRPPHRGLSVREILDRIPAFEVDLPDAPGELAELVADAMSASPSGRPESAEAFRRRLRAFVEHRGSARLAEQARDRLAELEALLASDEDPSRVRVYDLFGAIRFGYREALAAWPDNGAAQDGLREAALVMARWELGQGDDRAAEVLLAALDEVPAGVLADLERVRTQRLTNLGLLERLARERDPTLGRGLRMAAVVGMGALWTASPILADSSGPAFRLGLSGFWLLVLVLAFGVGGRAWTASVINRRVAMLLIAGVFGQAVLMAGVPLGVIDMRASLATLHVQKSVLLLMAAMLVDRRFGVASLAFALAYLLFVPLEPWRAEVSAVAHGTISVVAAWIWWPRGEA